jgi:photosystem I subunit X
MAIAHALPWQVADGTLFFAAIPHTEPWGFNTAMVTIACNSIVVAIGSFMLANPGSNLSSPVGKSDLVRNFNLAKLIAMMSFGHILGVGMVLGLTNIGAI